MNRFLAAAAILSLAAPALADEVWDTPYGQVIYEADIGDVAVLSYPLDGGTRGHAYFPGLGGNFDNRGVHWGYWIEERDGGCASVMTGPDDKSSNAWGRVVIAFDESGFPSAFTGIAGECWGDPVYHIRATPVTAQ